MSINSFRCSMEIQDKLRSLLRTTTMTKGNQRSVFTSEEKRSLSLECRNPTWFLYIYFALCRLCRKSKRGAESGNVRAGATFQFCGGGLPKCANDLSDGGE